MENERVVPGERGFEPLVPSVISPLPASASDIHIRSLALEYASRVDQGTGKAGPYVVGKAILFERYLKGENTE